MSSVYVMCHAFEILMKIAYILATKLYQMSKFKFMNGLTGKDCMVSCLYIIYVVQSYILQQLLQLCLLFSNFEQRIILTDNFSR